MKKIYTKPCIEAHKVGEAVILAGSNVQITKGNKLDGTGVAESKKTYEVYFDWDDETDQNIQ